MSEDLSPEAHLAKLDATITGHRAKMEADPEALSPEYADALLGLAGMLAEQGQHNEALAAAEEGVEHLRSLHAKDAQTYSLHLASALNNLSNRLSELGDDEEGRATGDQAMNFANDALAKNPEQARFVMVSTLMNQSGRSWRGGQPLRALEEIGTAVDIFRQGGESMMPFLGVMVDALHRNAMTLSEAGRWDESIAVRRMCVNIFPKDQIPLPVLHLLAITLQQGAYARSREGYPGESLPMIEEAVEIALGLHEVQPDNYILFLAQTIANLAGRQYEADATEQALDACAEAVNRFQEAAKIDATATIVPLSATLEVFAAILNDLGHVDQAKAVLAQREQLAPALAQLQGAEGGEE